MAFNSDAIDPWTHRGQGSQSCPAEGCPRGVVSRPSTMATCLATNSWLYEAISRRIDNDHASADTAMTHGRICRRPKGRRDAARVGVRISILRYV